MKDLFSTPNVTGPRSRGRPGRWLPGFAGTLLTVILADGPALAAAGSTARADPGAASARTDPARADPARADPARADPVPTGPCRTPSVSAAAVFIPAKTIFCLQAARGNARVTLTWQPVIPESPRSAFFVYYQATDTEVVTDFGPVTDGKVAVPDLTNGTAYVFWIARGESANAVSNGVRAVPATVPDEPTGLTASATNGQVTLDWTAPATDGGTPVSGYDLYEGTAADLSASAPIAGRSWPPPPSLRARRRGRAGVPPGAGGRGGRAPSAGRSGW